MVSLTIVCQFLCIVALNSLSMSEKGVTKRRILVSGYDVRWDNRLLWLWVKSFLCF